MAARFDMAGWCMNLSAPVMNMRGRGCGPVMATGAEGRLPCWLGPSFGTRPESILAIVLSPRHLFTFRANGFERRRWSWRWYS